MSHVRALLACCLIGLVSCASDGGQRGTGITVAEGNIVSANGYGFRTSAAADRGPSGPTTNGPTR